MMVLVRGAVLYELGTPVGVGSVLSRCVRRGKAQGGVGVERWEVWFGRRVQFQGLGPSCRAAPPPLPPSFSLPPSLSLSFSSPPPSLSLSLSAAATRAKGGVDKNRDRLLHTQMCGTAVPRP
jgi:hypothetical protein